MGGSRWFKGHRKGNCMCIDSIYGSLENWFPQSSFSFRPQQVYTRDLDRVCGAAKGYGVCYQLAVVAAASQIASCVVRRRSSEGLRCRESDA